MNKGSWFFGYGSLVNCKSHHYPDTEPATLKGWQRRWVQTPAQDFCYLSANPVGHGVIDGLIARVPNDDWQALDEREAGYLRHPVSDLVESKARAENIQVYSIPSSDYEIDQAPKPILLSYLDVVLLGFDKVFGRQGVERFIETTDNWLRPILNDRAQPIYPRHQALQHDEQIWIDELLKKLPSQIKSSI